MSDLVLDNSAAIHLSAMGTIDDPDAQYYAPDLIDLEYASVLRKLVLREQLSSDRARDYVLEWASNALIRCSHVMLLPRIWALRDNITLYDAAYVALAEALEVPLVTADHRLAATAAAYCEVITVGSD